MSLFSDLLSQIWIVCMLAVVALSLWRGGWAERTIAIGMVVDSVAARLLENRRDWHAPQWADLAIDLTYLAVMLGVAIKSSRRWPLWAAAFQVIDVAIYLAFIADHHASAWAAYTAIAFWSYLILVAIVVGVLTRPRHGPAVVRGKGQVS